MGKFVNDGDFEDYRKAKDAEAADGGDTQSSGTFVRTWFTKNMEGTAENPKKYLIRFLPGPVKPWTKLMYYHMIKSTTDGSWKHFVCEKNWGIDNYCPLCAVSAKLYMGTAEEKKAASLWKRKKKFLANIMVIKDSRDAEINDDEKKASGKVMLYQYPEAVEKFLAQEIGDKEYGIGFKAVFDPTDEGYNFVLTVGSKKSKDKTFPDYALQPAKKASAIADSDEEIETLLEDCIDLTKYIDDNRAGKRAVERFLKEEFTIELIKNDALFKAYAEDVAVAEKNDEDPFKPHKVKEEAPAKEEKAEKAPSKDEEDDFETSPAKKTDKTPPAKEKPKEEKKPAVEDEDAAFLKELEDV